MVSRRTDKLLHLITHHTNLEQPYNENISGENYPAQDSERVGRTVTLKYKNRYETDFSDAPIINVDDENDNIYESEFIILRLDLSPPFKVIFLSTDYKVILVGDSRTYLDENKIFVYPKQIEEYLGLYLNNQYYDTPEMRLKGVLFSCDSTEPGYGVIAEFYRDNSVRFLLDTEVQSICFERYKLEQRDYNGSNPEFNPNPDPQELEYIDLNGAGVRDFGPIFKDIDGGFPDPLSDMYRVGVLTLEEVCELRGKIISERTIYGSPGIYPRHVELNVTSATLYREETLQLEATVTSTRPRTRSIDQTVTWRSSDESLATVDQNGLVIGVGSGLVKIYAISYDVWGRCIVDARIHTSSITLDPTSLNIIVGEQRLINVEVLPEEATDKRVGWSSSDPSVLTVRSGKVKAISPGTAIVTATTKEGGLQATCDVSVFSDHIPVESVRIKNISGNPKQLSLATNDPNVPKEFVMEVEVLPEDATNKEVYARAVNPYEDFAVYIEKISETNFRIKALCYCCEHKNVIEVRSNENPSIKDSVEVYVNTKLEEVVLSDTEVNLDPDFETSINTHLDLDINFLPNNKGIYPDLITTGVNKDQVLDVMDTLEIVGQGTTITAIDKQSYLNNKYTSNRISIDSGSPGIGYVRVTDIVSGQVKQCKINVGVPEITRINLRNVPEDWSKIKPEDEFRVDLDIDPYYWYQYPSSYSVTWEVINGNGNIEIYNYTTYINVKVVGACENVTIKATTNNGLSAQFIIPEIVFPIISLDLEQLSNKATHINEEMYINYNFNADYGYCPSNPKLYWESLDPSILRVETSETNNKYGQITVTNLSPNTTSGRIRVHSQGNKMSTGEPINEVLLYTIGDYATNITLNKSSIYIPDATVTEEIIARCNGINGVVNFTGEVPPCNISYRLDGQEGNSPTNYLTITPIQASFDQLANPGTATIIATCKDSVPGAEVTREITVNYGNQLNRLYFYLQTLDFDLENYQEPYDTFIQIEAEGIDTNYPPSCVLDSVRITIDNTNIMYIRGIYLSHITGNTKTYTIQCTAKDIGTTMIHAEFTKPNGEIFKISKAINVYGVKITNPITIMATNDNYQLETGKHLPSDISDELYFYTSDSNIAAISGEGTIYTYLNAGTATIRVYAPDTGKYKDELELTVKENKLLDFHYPNTYSKFGIDVDNEPAEKVFVLYANSEYPGETPSSSCIWSSSNTDVLTVDRTGYVAKEDPDDPDDQYNFYTTYNIVGTGTTTITAITTAGTASFLVTVYDVDNPVYINNLLNIHQINITYSDDALQYLFNVICPDLAVIGQIDYTYTDGRDPYNLTETQDYNTGTKVYSSDDSEVAVMGGSGLLNIVPIPDVNKFEYYNPDGTPKDEVYLELYVYIKITLEVGVYYDKCLIKIRGENLSENPNISSIILAARLISGGTDTGTDYTFNQDSNQMQLRIVASPYYIGSQQNAITFDLNDEETDSPMYTNYQACAIGDDITVHFSQSDFEDLSDNDFNFNAVGGNYYRGAEGEYNYNNSTGDEWIHNFNNVGGSTFVTDYDYRLKHRVLKLYLDENKIINNLLPFEFKVPDNVPITKN